MSSNSEGMAGRNGVSAAAPRSSRLAPRPLRLGGSQRRRELVEHAVHVLVAVGAPVRLRELDRLVDDDLERHVGGVLELPRGEQQDAALDRRERLHPPVERRRDRDLERLRVRDRAVEQRAEVLAAAFLEVFVLAEVPPDGDRRVAGELPLIEALQGVLARPAASGLHLCCRSTARSRFAISTATSAQSRPFGPARSSAWASVSVVRMPFATGIPVSSPTWVRPAADSFATISK